MSFQVQCSTRLNVFQKSPKGDIFLLLYWTKNKLNYFPNNDSAYFNVWQRTEFLNWEWKYLLLSRLAVNEKRTEWIGLKLHWESGSLWNCQCERREIILSTRGKFSGKRGDYDSIVLFKQNLDAANAWQLTFVESSWIIFGTIHLFLSIHCLSYFKLEYLKKNLFLVIFIISLLSGLVLSIDWKEKVNKSKRKKIRAKKRRNQVSESFVESFWALLIERVASFSSNVFVLLLFEFALWREFSKNLVIFTRSKIY